MGPDPYQYRSDRNSRKNENQKRYQMNKIDYFWLLILINQIFPVFSVSNVLEVTQSITWNAETVVWRSGTNNYLKFRIHEKFLDIYQRCSYPHEQIGCSYRIEYVAFVVLSPDEVLGRNMISGVDFNSLVEMRSQYQIFDYQDTFNIRPESSFEYTGLIHDFVLNFSAYDRLPRENSYGFGVGITDMNGRTFFYFASDFAINSYPILSDGPWVIYHTGHEFLVRRNGLEYDSLTIANDYAKNEYIQGSRRRQHLMEKSHDMFRYLSVDEFRRIFDTCLLLENSLYLARLRLSLIRLSEPVGDPQLLPGVRHYQRQEFLESANNGQFSNIDTDISCAICLNSLRETQNTDMNEITRTKCNHFYHRNCFERMKMNSHLCPLCREDLRYRK